MDWQDATTRELLKELANRYECVAVVGKPKDDQDEAVFLAGNKGELDDLMGKAIASKFELRYARDKESNMPVDVVMPSTEQSTAALIKAMGELHDPLIFAGIPKVEGTKKATIVCNGMNNRIAMTKLKNQLSDALVNMPK